MALWKRLTRKLTGLLTGSFDADISLLSAFVEMDMREAQGFVGQHPELLEERFDGLLSAWRGAEQEPGLRWLLEDRRLLLSRARAVGVERAFSEKMEEIDGRARATIEFTNCDDLRESRNIVLRNPYLLSDDFLRILTLLTERSESEEGRLLLEERRALLVRCREVGVDAAYAEASGKAAFTFNDGVSPEGVLAGLSSGRWDARYREALRAHPELLGRGIDDALREAAMGADDEGERHRIGMCRARLALCRLGLADEAFDEGWRPGVSAVLRAFDDSLGDYEIALGLTKENALVNYIARNPRLLARLEAIRSQTGWLAIPSDCPTPKGFEAHHAALDVLKLGEDRLRARAALIGLCEGILRGLADEQEPHFRAYVQYVMGEALALGDIRSLLDAVRCYQGALRFYTKERPLDHVVVSTRLARTLGQLDVDEKVDTVQLAIGVLEEALPLCSPEKSTSWYGEVHRALGDAHRRRAKGLKAGDFNEAIGHYREVIRVFKPGEFDGGSGIWEDDYVEALKSLEGCYLAQGLWEPALEVIEEAIAVGQESFDSDFTDERKEKHTSATAVLYQHAAYAHGRLGRADEALRYLERGRTRVLGRALELRVPRPEGVPDDVWGAFEAAAGRVRDFYWWDALREEGGFDNEDWMESVEELRGRFAGLEARLDEAAVRVKEFAPHFMAEADARGIYAALPDPHTALVTLCTIELGSLAFIFTKDGESRIVNIPDFDSGALESLLWERNKLGQPVGGWLLTQLIARDSDADERDEEACRATIESTLESLGRALLAPILRELPEQIKHIIFMPPGMLALLPLHAAPLPSAGPELLCDRYLVSYIPSVKLLLACHSGASREVSESVYALINPEEDPRLIFTHIEGAALARVFAESEICEGAEGTKDAFLNGLGGQSYLHFSCHGKYDELEPGESGLILAEGEIFSVDELLEGEINLSHLRLVTLSACETGMVDIFRGNAEEYAALPAGFMLAGVPCVVSSLWAVPDISSAILMEQFYHNHIKKGMTLVEALTEAQKTVRHMKVTEVGDYISKYYPSYEDERRAELFRHKQHYQFLESRSPEQRPFVHPYYWAAFVVNGM